MTRYLFGKIIWAIFLVAIVVMLFGSPMANAALVPCKQCTVCDIFLLISNVANFAVSTLTPIIAVVLFLISGFIMIFGGASPGALTRGKKMFWDTVIGVVIVYSAFMITNFIIRAFVASNSVSTGWFHFTCTQQPGGIPTGPPAGGATTAGGATAGGSSGGSGGTTVTRAQWTPPPAVAGGGGLLNEASLESALNNAGVNFGPTEGGLPICTDPPQGECGYLQGMQQRTLAELTSLKQNCPYCTVTITDATGPGHLSLEGHYQGKKFDLAPTSNLTSYIQSKFTCSSDGTKCLNGTTVYTLESDHWDVLVQ